MYGWLFQEFTEIKTPRFHVREFKPDTTIASVASVDEALPDSYRDFIESFGGVKLYRRPGSESYRIGVFAQPQLATRQGRRAYLIGFHDGARVLLCPVDGSDKCEIVEVEGDQEERMGTSFDDWLYSAGTRARKSYGREKWQEIVRGPAPFTPRELELIDARSQAKWRVLEIGSDGDHVIEFVNGSTIVIPMYTIGVRTKDGGLNGSVYLKTDHVQPGCAAVLRANCYKKLVSPNDIELFDLPDPKPEDRERFAELSDVL